MKKVTFLISNSCNLKCKHCFVNAGKRTDNEMTEEEKYKAIDNLANIGVQKICFSGGEPLINKNIFNYISYTKKLGLDVGFLSNGILLDNNKIEELEKLHINSLSISLYTNDIIEISDYMYREYLKKIIFVLKKLSTSTIKYKLTIPISKNNLEDVYKLLELLVDNNIKPKTVRIYIITPIGRAKFNKDMCTENMDLSKILNELPVKVKESDLNISIERSSIDVQDTELIYKYGKCQLLYYKDNYINEFADPHMDVNGDLYLCGILLREKKYCCGNILKNSKFDIFENINNIVQEIENNKKIDFCPMLNRQKNEKKCLVCPIVYIETNYKKS